jgi:hypothetical protein
MEVLSFLERLDSRKSCRGSISAISVSHSNLKLKRIRKKHYAVFGHGF